MRAGNVVQEKAHKTSATTATVFFMPLSLFEALLGVKAIIHSPHAFPGISGRC